MLVYGDSERIVATADEIRGLAASLRSLNAEAPGIARHGALVSAFVTASGLVQGIADAEFEARGHDARSPAQGAGMRLLLALAQSIGRSWRGRLGGSAAGWEQPLGALLALLLPQQIRIRRAEGYAFYALYPEAYIEAAQALAGGDPVRVIGIRSIGVGLAAMVAAALDAPEPDTLRPVGHPFDRRIAAAPELTAALAADADARFAVVDEGPGLSGSSFGAVGDWLEGLGVERARIHFFPSHGGDPGPKASASHRARWMQAKRHVVSFDKLILESANPVHRLEAWAADLVGAPLAPLHDISGGAWRSLLYRAEADWPAANIQQERRKFLLRTRSGTWLLKFAGHGPEGTAKLERARLLHEAGFAAEPMGYRHGFLIERWISEAVPFGHDPPQRSALLDVIGRYIGFRARCLPVPGAPGASLSGLLEMARHNASEALGLDIARFGAWMPRLAELETRVRQVETDNRMHPWEWLRAADGRIVKTDALDHHAAHDLVGCQDAAWDVVGAEVEFGLDAAEAAHLRARVEREAGRAVDAELLAFYRSCYLAFQLGASMLAAASLAGCPAEARRLDAEARRYRLLLASELRA